MKTKHAKEVTDVLQAAFNDWSFKRRGIARFRKRKVESIIPYIECEPDGCFVAIEKKAVVGAIFSHTWGKLGWIGTFGIDPDHQSQGIGKKLMEEAINYLDKEKNVTTLGLETMPDSSSNIGLYSKLGFKPAFLTIRLTKQLEESKIKTDRFDDFVSKNNLEISHFSEEDQKEDALQRCSWLASKLVNGLSYTPEITLTVNNEFGDLILLKRDGFIIGYALCRTFDKYKQEEDDKRLFVRTLVLDTDYKDPQFLDYLCNVCERFGLSSNKNEMRLSINSSYWLAYKHLLNSFNVRSSILRMIKYSDEIKSYDHYHEWLVNCATWTM
jgi:GNAT superfamily N-acetyltransferase